MAFQPTLDTALAALEGSFFRITHANGYYDGVTTPVDGAHIHSCYEIYVNISGDISFLHGSAVTDIESGDAVVSHPSDVHYCIYRSPCMHDHYCIWLDGAEIGRFLEAHSVRGRIRLSVEDKHRLFSLLGELESATDPLLRTARLLELITLLAKEAHADVIDEPLPPILKEILAYLDLGYLDLTSTHELAERFFISESTINRMFRRYVGISVGKFIEAKKLSHAERLLRQGLAVTDACYASGFSDCSRFIAFFKKKFGVTPHKYKAARYVQK
jgi:AraC-like DNA-binding protein